MHPNTISVNTRNNNQTNYITTQTWFSHPLSFSPLFLSSSWFFSSVLSRPWSPVTITLPTRLSGHERRRGSLREQGLTWGRSTNQQSRQFRHFKFLMFEIMFVSSNEVCDFWFFVVYKAESWWRCYQVCSVSPSTGFRPSPTQRAEAIGTLVASNQCLFEKELLAFG